MINSIFQKLKSSLSIVLIATISFFVFSYLLAMTMGIVVFFFTTDGLSFSNSYIQGFTVQLFAFTFDVPLFVKAGIPFFSFWVIFLLCFIVAGKARNGFFNIIKDSLSNPMNLPKNYLSILPIIACMSLTLVTMIHSLQEGYGVPTGSPPISSDPFPALFSLTYASIIEEVGFRLLPIGAFLVFYLLWTKQENVLGESSLQMIKIILLTLLHPEKGKTAFKSYSVFDSGIRKGISVPEWIVLLFSSIIFGLSHYPLSGSWELGKITTSFVDGLIFGAIYLIYGVHASILLHWFRNYYLYLYYVLVLKFFPSFFPIVGVIEILTFGYDLAFFHIPSFGLLCWLSLVFYFVYKKLTMRFPLQRSHK